MEPLQLVGLYVVRTAADSRRKLNIEPWTANRSPAGLTSYQQGTDRRPNNCGGTFPRDCRSLRCKDSTRKPGGVTTKTTQRTVHSTVSVVVSPRAALKPRIGMRCGVCWLSLPRGKSRHNNAIPNVRNEAEARCAGNLDLARRESTESMGIRWRQTSLPKSPKVVPNCSMRFLMK